MPTPRRTVLLALLAVVALVAALMLRRVLATVFFAVTVAYVLVPLYLWLHRRGLPRWWASALSTTLAFLGVVAVLVPIGTVLYLRREQLVDLLGAVPDRIPIELAGFSYVVDVGEVTALAAAYLTRVAIGVARAAPELLAHALVFAFVVFALLLRRGQVRRALLTALPEGYHDVGLAVNERVRETLFALYVIQAATALGTFLIAFAVFAALGYPFALTLAVVAGVLQFLPVVGPSLVVIALAAYEVSVGAYADAVAILVLGILLVGVLPDAVIRPRLASQTAGLPASLYLVGFVGGVLSLGPIGIIAGPLVVAVLVEVLGLLAAEVERENGGTAPSPTDPPGPSGDVPGPSDPTSTSHAAGPDETPVDFPPDLGTASEPLGGPGDSPGPAGEPGE